MTLSFFTRLLQLGDKKRPSLIQFVGFAATVFFIFVPLSLEASPTPQPLFLDFLLQGKNIDPDWIHLARPRIYLLAWSPEGLVLTAQTDESALEVRFEVWDTVEDVLRERSELPGWQTGDEAAWWSSREKTLQGLKQKWRLIDCNYQMGTFPLIDENDVFFQPLLELDRNGSSPWGTRLRLVIHGGGKGSKTVLDRRGVWRKALLLGFIPSPFEDRILILVAVQPSGWNEEKTPVQFLLVGASLIVGFDS